MKLKKIYYTQEHYGREWKICAKGSQPIELQDVNLIVGKNAAGKSSVVRVVRTLADLLCGDTIPSKLLYSTASFDVTFEDDDKLYNYRLTFQKGKITEENLSIDGTPHIQRTNGNGTIRYSNIGEMIEFATGESTLAVTREDTLQHPYLTPLQNWGRWLNHFSFSTKMGQNIGIKEGERELQNNENISVKESSRVADMFSQGCAHDDGFIGKIIDDAKAINYNISGLSIEDIHHPTLNAKVMAVNEDRLAGYTDQTEMSSGMFRAFSLLIQIEYAILRKTSTCILIDDIGEGLDFDRSKKIIALIKQKATDNGIQLIMTTNDENVMNCIDIDYWQIIVREDGRAVFYNKQNTKELFDEFEYAGFSNSKFFKLNMFKEDN